MSTSVVTPEEILQHAEADHRVLEAAERYAERQARWHGHLIRALSAARRRQHLRRRRAPPSDGRHRPG
jgi:hypothetical protein